MISKLKIFTDGSCLDNPGPGGYAYVYVKNNVSVRPTLLLAFLVLAINTNIQLIYFFIHLM